MPTTDFALLRHQVRTLGRRGSAGYPPELRERLVAAARELRAARFAWVAVAEQLGVSVGFIRGALQAPARGIALVPVHIAPAAAAATPITLHSPAGWRVEGLRLDDLAAILAALS